MLELLIVFTRKKLVSCEYKYKVQLYLQTFLNTKVQIDQCASTLNPLFTMPNTLSAQENRSLQNLCALEISSFTRHFVTFFSSTSYS